MPRPDRVSSHELGCVAEAMAEVDAADAAVRALVAAAREAGESWRRIGEAVGISDELARQRWRPGPVVTHGGAGVSVTGCDLHVTEIYAGV